MEYETLHEQVAARAVDRFVDLTTTAQGTPLFRKQGPTADLLRQVIVNAMHEIEASA